MKFKFLKVAFAGIVLFVSSFNVANAGLIKGGSYSSNSSLMFSDFGQSFISIDKYINSLSVYVGDWNNHQNSPFEIRVTLFDSDNWSGNTIFDKPFELPMHFTGDNLGEMGSGGSWYTFDLGSVSVIQGNAYAFKLSSTYGNGGIYFTHNHAYDSYIYGNLIESWDTTDADNFYKPIGGYMVDGDLAFVIEGSDTVQDVPEPSTLAIFALGIMGLVSRRFKKQ